MYKLKANTVKLMINSFANGELELVRKFHAQYGDTLFNYVPRIKSGNYHRLIFYAFKNGHFNIINFYLSLPNSKVSESEVRGFAEHIAHRENFYKLKEYESNELLKAHITQDYLFNQVSIFVTRSYDIDLIDQFLDKFPDKFEDILKQCSTSSKGIQLRRHLQLRQLV